MIRKILCALSILVIFGCTASHTSTSTKTVTTTPLNALTDQEKKDGWTLLFDGNTKNGWHVYNKKTDGSAWKVEGGTLYVDSKTQRGGGGDIVSDNEYENFHLKLEWKLDSAGNSGIIFMSQEDPKYRYAWVTGPEMQIIDNDRHADAKNIKHRAGDLYDLISASAEVAKPIGEWNQFEIILNNSKLDLIFNGTKIVSTTVWDDNWQTLKANSKFKSMTDFGTFRKGRIALQDHGDKVWFRNIKIKTL